MICIWSSGCHCHPIISCFIKIQNGLHFWCWFTQVVLEEKLLNVCSLVQYKIILILPCLTLLAWCAWARQEQMRETAWWCADARTVLLHSIWWYTGHQSPRLHYESTSFGCQPSADSSATSVHHIRQSGIHCSQSTDVEPAAYAFMWPFPQHFWFGRLLRTFLFSEC